MTQDKPAHIEPSKHSTAEVDEALDLVQGNVDATPGAGSPAIMLEQTQTMTGSPLPTRATSPTRLCAPRPRTYCMHNVRL